MKIEHAVREKIFTITSLAGLPGSGKTYSSLLYARGLVGPEGKIGLIDTENKRSRFYADSVTTFDVIDLYPPFIPSRILEAVKTFEEAGYDAIIVDSISHEWDGSGGVVEQAEAIEQAMRRPGLHCWSKPKAAHKKLMNGLLQARAHLILCCRAKERLVQVLGNDGRTEIISEGLIPVQDKMFGYEMTISLMLENGSHAPTILKCPEEIAFAFPPQDTISCETGRMVAQWAANGVAVDASLESDRQDGMAAASKGMAALSVWWSSLGDKKAKLLNFKDDLKSMAAAIDEAKADIREASGGANMDIFAERQKELTDAENREGFSEERVLAKISTLSNKPAVEKTGSDGQTPFVGEENDVISANGEPLKAIPPFKRMLMQECIDNILRDAASKPATLANAKIDKVRDAFLEPGNLGDFPDFVNRCADIAKLVANNSYEIKQARKDLAEIADSTSVEERSLPSRLDAKLKLVG